MSPNTARWLVALLMGGISTLVMGGLLATMKALADEERPRIAECLQRCEPHPVAERTTKADGSLGCICDETRTVR